jgi:hypothetical protein
MGGRSAFADKAAEAAALPDEAAAEVLSPSSSVKFVDFAVGSDPAGAAGSKATGGLLEKQGSASLQQQPLQPQPPNKPASDVVLVKVSASKDSNVCSADNQGAVAVNLISLWFGFGASTAVKMAEHA